MCRVIQKCLEYNVAPHPHVVAALHCTAGIITPPWHGNLHLFIDRLNPISDLIREPPSIKSISAWLYTCTEGAGAKTIVFVYFLVLGTIGTSMLLCWPSAWNEKCLMPLVCLEGLSLFRRWTAMHYWLQNTPAMLFHLSSTAGCELGFLSLSLALFFFLDSVCINVCTLLTGCTASFVHVCKNAFSPLRAPLSLSHPLFSITRSGRINGRCAGTTPLSPHPCAHAGRWWRIAQDKRQR